MLIKLVKNIISFGEKNVKSHHMPHVGPFVKLLLGKNRTKRRLVIVI